MRVIRYKATLLVGLVLRSNHTTAVDFGLQAAGQREEDAQKDKIEYCTQVVTCIMSQYFGSYMDICQMNCMQAYIHISTVL